MSDCIFCRIVAGQIPSAKVYEDDQILGFKDINPQSPVHILVVPKVHVANIMELADDGLMARLLAAVRTVAREQGLDRTGFRLVTNTGPHSAQSVPHVHFHVMGGAQLSGRMG